VRPLDVQGLGWDAAVVDIEGETLLLIDADLCVDDRIKVLNRALAEVEG
jgi:hypothetical protein